MHMSGGVFDVLIIAIVIDLVAAIAVSRVVHRRGYTGLKKSLLLALAWLVPFIGALWAAWTIWEYEQRASRPHPVAESPVGREASQTSVAQGVRKPT